MNAALTNHDRFERFKANNPHIKPNIVSLAREARAKGFSTYGIGALFEILRWNAGVTTTGDRFKLNNDWRARIAREVMDENPDLQGFFLTRASAADHE